MNPINTILFDLDGTLVYHSHVLLPHKLAEWGYARSPSRVEAVFAQEIQWFYEFAAELDEEQKRDETLWTKVWRELYRRVTAGLDIANPRVAEQMNSYFSAEPTPPLFEDVSPLIQALAEQGYRLGVITQRDRDAAERFLHENEIRGYFATVIGGNEGYGRKPQAGPFREALRQLESHPQEAVYIGDRIDDDCGGAHAAGLRQAFLIDRTGEQVAKRDPALCVAFTHLSNLRDLLTHLPQNYPAPTRRGAP